MPYPTELLEIADMLDTLPDRLLTIGGRFDMSLFRDDGGQIHARDRGKNKPLCGTAACAAGWAAMLLPHLGLLTQAGSGGLYLNTPSGLKRYDFDAIQHACGLPDYQTTAYLFGPGLPSDPRYVAWRIRRFVADPTVAAADPADDGKSVYALYEKETARGPA